jgi:hypothetical protein
MKTSHTHAPARNSASGGQLVTQTIHHASAINPQYPLLAGDLLFEREDGSFGKVAPGLGIEGFMLSAEQRATLQPAADVTVVIE